jgi:GT2 family glycosyltransferase
VAMTGAIVADGVALKREISHEESLALLHSVRLTASTVRDSREWLGGCGVVRAAVLKRTLFDERLTLYGWLEDRDFASRVRSQGKVAFVSDAVIVHRGAKSGGRYSHVRLGYSQVVNPVYLRLKGSIGWRDCLWILTTVMPSNFVRSVAGRQVHDRRQRLHGNLLAVCDLARGRVRPERIRDLGG